MLVFALYLIPFIFADGLIRKYVLVDTPLPSPYRNRRISTLIAIALMVVGEIVVNINAWIWVFRGGKGASTAVIGIVLYVIEASILLPIIYWGTLFVMSVLPGLKRKLGG